MYYTHKFLDESAHESTIKSNTRDMMEQYVLRNIRESFANMGLTHYPDPEDRVHKRIFVWVRENYETATMSDIADFLSLIAHEEIHP